MYINLFTGVCKQRVCEGDVLPCLYISSSELLHSSSGPPVVYLCPGDYEAMPHDPGRRQHTIHLNTSVQCMYTCSTVIDK